MAILLGIVVATFLGYVVINLYFQSVPPMAINCDQYYNAPASDVPLSCQ